MLRIFAALAIGLVALATVAGGDGVASPRPALAAEEAVTYHLDVQPILQSRCSERHAPPATAQYTFLSPRITARPRARSKLNALMPPSRNPQAVASRTTFIRYLRRQS